MLAISTGLPWSRAAAPSASAAESIPLRPSVVSDARAIKGPDDRTHLVYELKLTSQFSKPVRLTSISVRNSGSLQTLRGSELDHAMSLERDPSKPTASVPRSEVAVVWMDVPVSGDRIPASLEHTFDLTYTSAGAPIRISYSGASTEVNARAPIDLTPPLRGRGWVTFAGCCGAPVEGSLEPQHPQLSLDQRYATDWSEMDGGGRFVTGDSDVDPAWVSYGKPVYAVANGTISGIIDDAPDQAPDHSEPVASDRLSGNRVVLRLPDGRFAVYEHLKAGSVHLRQNQFVHAGEQIAEVGNSGDSSVPHLSFQVEESTSTGSIGIPFVLHKFDFDGQLPAFDSSLEARIKAGDQIAIDRAGRRVDDTAALPMDRDVVNFPET